MAYFVFFYSEQSQLEIEKNQGYSLLSRSSNVSSWQLLPCLPTSKIFWTSGSQQ